MYHRHVWPGKLDTRRGHSDLDTKRSSLTVADRDGDRPWCMMGLLEPSRVARLPPAEERGARGAYATSLPKNLRPDHPGAGRPDVGAGPDPALEKALEGIKPEQVLAAYQGPRLRRVRGPGPGHARRGEDGRLPDRQFQQMGLKPGNPDGTYVQDVPLVGFQATSVDGLVPDAGRPRSRLTFPDDCVAVSRRMAQEVKVDEFRRRLRRLRRGRARVRLGRLQGARRPRQDAGHAGQRPGRPRPQGPRRSSTRPCSRGGR